MRIRENVEDATTMYVTKTPHKVIELENTGKRGVNARIFRWFAGSEGTEMNTKVHYHCGLDGMRIAARTIPSILANKR